MQALKSGSYALLGVCAQDLSWMGWGGDPVPPTPAAPLRFHSSEPTTRSHFHFRRGQSANKHIIRDPLSMESLFSKFVSDHEMHK